MSVITRPDAADDLIVLANSEPQRVLDLVGPLDAEPGVQATPTQCRAVAIAHRVLGDLRAASDAAIEGARRAGAAGDLRGQAMCQLTAAPVLAQLGDIPAALLSVDDAEHVLSGLDLAELRFQRGGILGLVADYRRAIREYDLALNTFRSEDVTIWQADALMNRGLMHACLGDSRGAAMDLAEASSIFEHEGDRIGVGAAAHNAALAELMTGDAHRALNDLESAAAVLVEAGFPPEMFWIDHCAALIAVGLRKEAIELATNGVRSLEASGNVLEAATQRLLLARSLAIVGRPRDAAEHAEIAAAAYRSQGQEHRARRAAVVRLSIELESGVDPSRILDESLEITTFFAGLGERPDWLGEALLLRARAGLFADDLDESASELARHRRLLVPFEQEVQRALLVAQLAERTGERGRAIRAARSGVRLVKQAQRSAASPEMRDALSEHLVGLGMVGIRGLLDARRPRDAYGFIEELNAVRVEVLHARRPGSPASAALIERRAVTKAITAAEDVGRDASPLVRRAREVERIIRSERSRRPASPRPQKSDGGKDQPFVDSSSNLAAHRYVVLDGSVWVLDQARGGVRARELCGETDVIHATRELLHALRRSLFGGGAADDVDEIAAAVDELLGLPGRLGDNDEVVNLMPGAALPSVPFGLLPSLQDRAWVVASTGRPAPLRRQPGAVVLVAGPGLEYAEREVDRLSVAYPNARVLTGASATCDEFSAATDGARAVHIAAHSSVNPDNPMFSSVQLWDGEFTVHELSRLTRPPRTIVLASCESAGGVRVGTGLTGLTNGLLRLGVRSVVGTACEIPDSAETLAVMERFHESGTSRGALETPWESLRRLRNADELTPSQQLIARCFTPAALHAIG